MHTFDFTNYCPPDLNSWKGRVDGEDYDAMRWHQLVELVDLRKENNFSKAFVLLGFCCDEGVRRNQGRVGAKDGPASFRKVLANLPIHFSEDTILKDAGDICCDAGDLEFAQLLLAEAVAKILHGGGFPIVLGGGHEVTYGHYQGLKKIANTDRIGVINIDAHLDIRRPVEGKGNSGTGFYQIATVCEAEKSAFHYLAIGIQEISNTKALFNYAVEKEVNIIYAHELILSNVERIKTIINAFSQQVDHIYLTIDMDAFAAPYAPGVSALSFNGIVPDDNFFTILSTIFRLPNLRTIDVAELNPQYDIDNRTARLGASLLFEFLKRNS